MTATTAGQAAELEVLSVFSGIGGLDLGLEWAGMRVLAQVEKDSFCRAVLAQHWPKVPRHDDIHTAPAWWRTLGSPAVDLVAGGFPCQPVSLAGKGLAQADPRWLWPPMADLIAEVHPEWVLFENVPGLRTRGLELVTTDLENLGYTVRVGTLSACAMGAPFMRRRMFGVAHAPRFRRRTRRPRRPTGQTPHRDHQPPQRLAALSTQQRRRTGHWAREPRMDRLVDGLSPRLVEHHLRALGNAVVPAAAEHLGQLILAAHHGRHG